MLGELVTAPLLVAVGGFRAAAPPGRPAGPAAPAAAVSCRLPKTLTRSRALLRPPPPTTTQPYRLPVGLWRHGARTGADASLVDAWLPTGKTLFALQAERIRRLQQLAAEHTGATTAGVIQWYIMTSPQTHAATDLNLQANGFYGLDPTQVRRWWWWRRARARGRSFVYRACWRRRETAFFLAVVCRAPAMHRSTTRPALVRSSMCRGALPVSRRD